MDEKILQVLEKQPKLLDEKEKRVLMSLGYRINGGDRDKEGDNKMRGRVNMRQGDRMIQQGC